MQASLPSHCRSVIKVLLFSRFSPPAPKFFIKPQPPKEEGAQSERSASAESSSSDGGTEEPAEAPGAAGDPAREPADDSLEAQVDFSSAPAVCIASPSLPRKSRAGAEHRFCCCAVMCPESRLDTGLLGREK